MKYTLYLLLTCLFFPISLLSQESTKEKTFLELPDQRVFSNNNVTVIEYESLDGSVYEKFPGESSIKIIQSNQMSDFNRLVIDMNISNQNNSNKILEYTRLDGETYYTFNKKTWFKNIDNIKSTESNVELISANPNNEITTVELFPNPAVTVVNFRILMSEAAQVQAVIYNEMGQNMVEVINQKLNIGEQFINVDISQFSTGNYSIVFDYGDAHKETLRFVKIK